MAIYLLDSIGNGPNQTLTLIIPGQPNATLTLNFVDQQKGWFFSLVWKEFGCFNQRITSGQNILNPYRNILPFAIFCSTTVPVDPVTQDAFQNYASLYLMDSVSAEEIRAVFNAY